MEEEFFTLSAREAAYLVHWLREHFLEHVYSAYGPSFKITTSTTGIGNITFVKCLKCGREKDVTDYDIW